MILAGVEGGKTVLYTIFSGCKSKQAVVERLIQICEGLIHIFLELIYER